MADDPIHRFKVDFVEKNRMIVWRQHDQMHAVRPDPIFVGWTRLSVGSNTGPRRPPLVHAAAHHHRRRGAAPRIAG